MVKYLLASHGLFSEGTESFLNIMCGKKENLYTLSAFLDERSIESLVKDKLEEIGEYEQLIVFCDLYGGSVAQEIYRQTASDSRDIQIIAGYNLALVLDILLQDRVLTKEEILERIEGNKDAMVYIDREINASIDEDLF